MAGRLDGDLNTESLQVDDCAEDDDGGQQVHDIGEILAVKSFAECNGLVWPGEKEMNESDDCTLEFGTTTGVDGGWRESFPHDGLADVGGNE